MKLLWAVLALAILVQVTTSLPVSKNKKDEKKKEDEERAKQEQDDHDQLVSELKLNNVKECECS